MNSNSLIVSKDCQKIDGYLRSCLYDLTREDYFLFSKTDNVLSLGEEYINFLREQGVVIEVPTKIKDQFKEIDFNFESYNQINCCYTEYPHLKPFKLLTKMLCRNFAIWLQSFKEHRIFLAELFSWLEHSIINTIEVHITDNFIDSDDLNEIATSYSNSFSRFFVYSDNSHLFESFFETNKTSSILVNSFDRFRNPTSQHDNFFISIPVFSESKDHNAYFNGKIYIDQQGIIKNAPETTSTFGNIDRVENAKQLAEIVSVPEFQKYWKISKDKIDICRDCEFRRMCVSESVPKQRADGSWYAINECDYNPYIAKWKEEYGYVSLSDSGVSVDDENFKVDLPKLNSIIERIWG
jgi:hypothetical protein